MQDLDEEGSIHSPTQSLPPPDTAELLAEMDELVDRRQDEIEHDIGGEEQEERIGVKTRSRGRGGNLGSSRRKAGRQCK